MSAYSLKTQAAYLFLGKILGFVVRSLAPIILVRWISMEEFGIYRQVLFVGMVAFPLLTLGIPQSLYYYYPRMPNELTKFLSHTFSLLALTTLAGSILLIIVCGGFHFLPKEIGTEFVLPMALCFFLQSVSILFEHIFILEKKSRLVFAGSLSNELFQVLFVLGSFILFRSVLGIVFGLIAFYAIRLLFILFYLVKHYAIRFRLSDRALLRDQIRYTLPLAGSACLGVIGTQIDQGIIAAMMSPEDFAVYALGGLGVLMVVTLVCSSVGTVCLPRLSELAAQNNKEGMRELWHKMISLNATLFLPTISFCYIFAEEIITILYTDKYLASANILRINLFVLAIQMLEYGRIPTAAGKTQVIFIGGVARSIVALTLSVTLIRVLGLYGVAIAYVAAFATNGIIQLYIVKKTLNVSMKQYLPWRKFLAISLTSIAVAIFLPYARSLGMSSIPTLAMAAPVYFGVIALVFRRLGYLDFGQWRTILSKG